MDFPLHEAVALEAAQSLCEHLLRNPADRALQLCITHCAPRHDLCSSAVHLSAIRSSTSRDGHCGSKTDGGEDILAMHSFNPSTSESNILNNVYGLNRHVVDGWIGQFEIFHTMTTTNVERAARPEFLL